MPWFGAPKAALPHMAAVRGRSPGPVGTRLLGRIPPVATGKEPSCAKGGETPEVEPPLSLWSTESDEESAAFLMGRVAAALEAAVTGRKVAVSARSGRTHPPSFLPYLMMLRDNFGDNTTIFVIALIYVERLLRRDQALLREHGGNRLFATSLMLASKFQEDHVRKNRFYAKACNLPVDFLNRLEQGVFKCLDYNLMIHPEEFEACHDALLGRKAHPPNGTFGGFGGFLARRGH